MLRSLPLSLVLPFLISGAAFACPLCAENPAHDPNLPRAFMVSILFMLSIPPLVLSGIGFVIWRAHRRHALAQQAMAAAESLAPLES